MSEPYNHDEDEGFSASFKCPYCGNLHTDMTDYGDIDESGAEVWCDSCGEKFFVSLHIQLSYSSRTIKPKPPSLEGVKE